MYLEIVILLLIGVYFVFFVHQFFNIVFKGYAPFISTDKETIRKIIQKIDIKEGLTIYELGCGQAKFLQITEKMFPRAKLIGVENLMIIFLINKLKLKLVSSRIKLLLNDFFQINLNKADIIYCYLNNATMQSLGEKFKQECEKGTLIISRSFPIIQFKPEKVIKIKNKNIYFYRI
jgi:hypothetical protein